MAVPSRAKESQPVALQGWQSIGLKKANTGEEKGDAVPQEPRIQLSAVSSENQPPIPRSEEDGILLIVPARIFGREIRVLIDSGATRNFISPAGVTQCGLTVESHNTFLELGDGKKGVVTGTSCQRPCGHVWFYNEDEPNSHQPVTWCRPCIGYGLA